MNSTTDSSQVDPSIRAADQRRLIVATGGIAILSWVGDFLFWNKPAGISVGIFFFVLAVALFCGGKRTRSGLFAACLLVAACVQSGIELCFTNIVTLVVLTIVLFGETAFGAIAAKWPRWSEALYAVMRGPARWADLIRSWAATPWTSNSRDALNSPTLNVAIRAAIPAAVLALVFAVLLAKGNAILAEAFSRLGAHVKAWLFDISFGRTVMWLVWLTVGVIFLWPRVASEKTRWWTRAIPQWSRQDERLARWQSAMILGAVNALFFAANTIDVFYLWAHGKLPDGVGYSEFVHQGVYALVAAVILAAATLVLLFQQQSTVARNSVLRWLAVAWIAQNIILILGVLRRLQLYVEAYQLSELRVYVACFLALVTVGFILLGREIWTGMKLGRLLFANGVATFVLFFTLQFSDVGTSVGNWNVSRWISGEHPSIDLNYLSSLGMRGWPGLARIATSDRNTMVSLEARVRLENASAYERESVQWADWRSYQSRAAARRADLLSR